MIYYILILYVAGFVPVIRQRFGEWIDTLMHPQVLFGMVLVVTLSTIGTGVLYLIDNRNMLRELFGTGLDAVKK